MNPSAPRHSSPGGSPDRRTALPPVGRLLAVDWGERRIGLALSDEGQTIAQPLATLTRRRGRRFPMKDLRVYLDAHQPVGVLVGLPLNQEGEEGPAAHAARATGELIGRVTGLPVAFADERMTSARARRAVREMGGRVRGREEEIDQLAATVLLQSFLEGRPACAP